VEESSVIATNVLNDLINYDKVAMGTLNTELELVSLWQLINTALKPFLVNARQAAVRLVLNSKFELDTDPQYRAALDSLMGVGDAIKISQVVRNLLSNALKFSPCGGEVLVTVRWDPLGLPHAAVPEPRGSGDSNKSAGDLIAWSSLARAGSLVLTVRDGGAGMSAEDQKNLFREGIQFNANQLQHGGGSGLGLWIAKGT
jgi:signal transduction histidine kinase